jgi:hypothetical protein
MSKLTEQRDQLARREAQDMFALARSKDAEIVKEREKAFSAQAQKTTRLRALRLAREAEERAAAAASAAAPKPAAKKKRAKAAAPDQ